MLSATLSARGARLLAVVIGLSAAAATAAQSTLQGEVDRLVRQAGLGDTRLGLIITDAESGETLAEHNPDESLVPASNMKLLSSGAALAGLGPDFAFETELLLDDSNGPRLIVRGSGDPAFGDPILLEAMGMNVEQLIGAWVTAWEQAVAGPPVEIIVDDRVFDREFVHPSWPVDQLNRWYCAEVGGFNLYTNCIALYLEPTTGGQRPRLGAEPLAPFLEIANRARTVTRGRHTPWASRVRNSNEITVHGDVRFRGQPVLVTVHDPPLTFGRLLADRVAARFGGGVIPVRTAETGEALDGAPLHVVRTRLDTVLARCNTDSHNLYAECLVKRVARDMTGRPGSWATGAAVMRSMLAERVGPTSSEVSVADGSGMSRDNRLTPRVIAAWLRSFHEDDELRAPFRDSLAAPGRGTLEKWFDEGAPRTELRAKSGYLNGVTALSGYLTEPRTGRTVIVSTIANEWPKDVRLSQVRELQEGLFLAADAWLLEQTAAQELRQGG